MFVFLALSPYRCSQKCEYVELALNKRFAVISSLYGLTSGKIFVATRMSSSTPSNSLLSYEKHNVAGLALGRTFPVLKAEVSWPVSHYGLVFVLHSFAMLTLRPFLYYLSFFR